MERGIVRSIQWCDTRDMTADGHTQGSIDRYAPTSHGRVILHIGPAKHPVLTPPEEFCKYRT
eukprot:3537996-Pyramimonas_sp.AAC.1